MSCAKLETSLARSALSAPTPEDSGVSFIEQSDTLRENLALVEPESSAQIFLSSCAGSWWGEFFNGRDYSSDSESGSGSE